MNKLPYELIKIDEISEILRNSSSKNEHASRSHRLITTSANVT